MKQVILTQRDVNKLLKRYETNYDFIGDLQDYINSPDDYKVYTNFFATYYPKLLKIRFVKENKDTSYLINRL